MTPFNPSPLIVNPETIQQDLAALQRILAADPAAVAELYDRHGRLLYGLWQTLMAQQRENEAALVEQQFNAAWTNATVKLRLEDL